MQKIELIGIKLPMIKKGDDLGKLIIKCAEKEKVGIKNNDIIVVAETIVSKAEGNLIDLNKVECSEFAKKLARKINKDPKLVEVILRESEELVKIGHDFVITETHHGFVCANAGVDESNVKKGFAKPLPKDPDKSAKTIYNKIKKETGKDIAVIISDTQGRPFRDGGIGVAVGVAGINPLWDRRGEKDLYGRKLKTTKIAVADEIASAASMVMGQANEGIPVVIVRGYKFDHLKGDGNAKLLLRKKEYDVFR